MSIVRDPGICYCECHKPGVTMMHCAPCCLGKCSVCKKHYKHREHREACEKRLNDLMEQASSL